MVERPRAVPVGRAVRLPIRFVRMLVCVKRPSESIAMWVPTSCDNVAMVEAVSAPPVDPVARVTRKGTKASIAEAMISSISIEVEAFFAVFLLFFAIIPPPSVSRTDWSGYKNPFSSKLYIVVNSQHTIR